MDEDIDGLGVEIRLRHIEVAVIDLVGVPGILHLVITVAILVAGGADDFHPVVVGRLLGVEHLLAQLLGDFHFGDRLLEIEAGGGAVLVAELHPTRQLRAFEVGGVCLLWHDGITFIPFETALTDIGCPHHRITVLDGIVYDSLHLLHRQVDRLLPDPVVRHLDGKLLIERMMSEGGYRDIVVNLDGKRLGVALGGVSLAVDGESLGHFTQVGVENRLIALAPGGRNLLVGIGLYRVEVSFQNGVKLAVDSASPPRS